MILDREGLKLSLKESRKKVKKFKMRAELLLREKDILIHTLSSKLDSTKKVYFLFFIIFLHFLIFF